MARLLSISPLEHAAFVALGLLVYVMVTRMGRQRRHPSAAVAWVIAIATMPYLATPLFLLFGTRKFARPLRRPAAAASLAAAGEAAAAAAAGTADAPSWATRLLAGLDVAPPTVNAAAAFHPDGMRSLHSLLALVAHARQRIDCCTYLLADDACGRRIAAALARAARRGVEVRLLLDAIGSMRTSRRQRRALRRAGVEVRRFMPLLHNPRRGRTNLRNHRKLVAVDGRWLWSGGRNLAAEYFVDGPGEPAWADLSFVVDGPLAVAAHEVFARDWRAARGRGPRRAVPPPAPSAPTTPAVAAAPTVPTASPTPTAPRTPATPTAPTLPTAPSTAPSTADAPARRPVVAQLVPSGPDRVDDTVHALLLAAAWQAERRLVAVTPYFVPDEALIDAWCMACRRGVEVTLVVPRRSNHRLADWARERALRALADAGGRVRLAPGMVHGKAVVVDDRLALCGSVNLDGRSLFLNYELVTAFYGSAQIGWLAEWIARQDARSATYVARMPPWWRDVVEGVVRVVGFQL